jgi:DNA polymerase III delta prime subunit
VPERGGSALLTERLRPQRLGDLVGNAAALESLRRWAKGWAPGRSPPSKRAALLIGRPGVGKTTAAWALAREEGWTVVEMNASEARNRTAIEQVAGRASLTNAFSDEGEYRSARAGGRTLILLDEADCLSGRATESSAPKATSLSFREFLRGRYGTVAALAEAWGLGAKGQPSAFADWTSVPTTAGRGAWTKLTAAQRDISDWRGAGEKHDSSDRGGLGAIASLVRTTLQPVVLTVNDPDSLRRYSPIFRTNVQTVEFGPVSPSDVRRLLRQVILKEHLTVQTAAIDRILERSQGDLRAALTDLEAIAPLPPGPMQVSVLGGRDERADIEAFVAEVLSHPRLYRNREIGNRLEGVTPDDLLPYFEENLSSAAPAGPRPYAAFEVLGRSELFISRARRYRHWGLWPYANELMTGGVSVALDRPEGAMAPEVRFPEFLRKMGRARAQRALRVATLLKLGKVLHLSVRKSNESLLPMLFRVFDPSERATGVVRMRAGLARGAKLSAEEVGYLMNLEPEADEVLALLDAAEPLVARAAPEARETVMEASESPPTEPAREEPAASPTPPTGPTKRTGRQRGLTEF